MGDWLRRSGQEREKIMKPQTQYLNHNSATFKALRIVDAAQVGVMPTTEGARVLESIRRYLYKTEPGDLWTL
jgi:hypothetical protein